MRYPFSMRKLTILVAFLAAGCCKLPEKDDGSITRTTTPGAKGTTNPPPAAPGTERSAVPTSAEWASGPRLTTNGDDSCEAKKVREWIQVYCRHCANDKKNPGAICSDKYDFADPQMARGAKTGEISFYSRKNPDKSSISAAVFPVRLGTDVAIRVPGVGGPPSTFGGAWRRGAAGPVIGFE